MNGQIKSLLNVCGMPNEDLMAIYDDPNKSFYMEQFANLIINDCINLCVKEGERLYGLPNNPLAYDIAQKMEDVEYMIKKHFGLK